MPGWPKNRWSSAASTARTTSSGISVSGTVRRRRRSRPVQGRQVRGVQGEALGPAAGRDLDSGHVAAVGAGPGRCETDPDQAALLGPLARNKGQRIRLDRVLPGPPGQVAPCVPQLVEPVREPREPEAHARHQLERCTEHHRRRRRQSRRQPRVELPRQGPVGQQGGCRAHEHQRENGLAVADPRRGPARPPPRAALRPGTCRASAAHGQCIGSSRRENMPDRRRVRLVAGSSARRPTTPQESEPPPGAILCKKDWSTEGQEGSRTGRSSACISRTPAPARWSRRWST